ncbi:unnamed protein product [Hyaloperonospora brassicae]|uniref:Uncharacterized protein n=1 Tax=Hyaloperonospora brassicae TaxID=162125 RepID=A0AAV0T499_HYABA|nr:unnamed protein product [Hyaloperonospora brassicae]
MAFAAADKRSAADAFDCESVEEHNAKKRTIDDVEDKSDGNGSGDDVAARPVVKKSKWIDEELPDVDDNEEFPPQTEERDDEEVACGLTEGQHDDGNVVTDEVHSRIVSCGHGMGDDVDLSRESRKDVDTPTDEKEEEEGEENEERKKERGEEEEEGGGIGGLDFAEEEGGEENDEEDEEEGEEEDEENDEDADGGESMGYQNHGIDIVDVDDDDGEEEGNGDGDGYEQFSDHDSEEEEEDGEEVDEDEDEEDEAADTVARARNQREARQLLQQLDGSTRSKLCLTVLEKYGEELLYGHEDARDAILVDACAHESALSLMRDAIRVRDLYARGSSAAAPVELDNDDDIDEEESEAAGYAVESGDDNIEEEGDEEAGGYEDEEEEADDEDGTIADEDDDDEVVVISEEEVEDTMVCEQDSESHLDESTHDEGYYGSEMEEGDVGSVKMLHPVTGDAGAERDAERCRADNNQDEQDADCEGAALDDTGAACDVVAPANTGVANVLSLRVPVADSAT